VQWANVGQYRDFAGVDILPDPYPMILQGKPHLRHRDHYYPSSSADTNHFVRARVEVWNVLKNLKRSYEGKEFAWELDPRCGHQQDLEI
jgi:hypothetical protein